MHFYKSVHWGLGLSFTVNDLDQPNTVIMYDVYTPFRLQRSYEINWTKSRYTYFIRNQLLMKIWEKNNRFFCSSFSLPKESNIKSKVTSILVGLEKGFL